MCCTNRGNVEHRLKVSENKVQGEYLGTGYGKLMMTNFMPHPLRPKGHYVGSITVAFNKIKLL